MITMESYAPGQFCWADLTASDVPAAKRFYGSLFDWAFVDVPNFAEELEAAHAYVMCRVGGSDVCGLRAGAGALWQSYVSVANADASARKAVDLGATLAGPAAPVLDI